jgi:aminoglycoside phosphotransferase (APT) family kinase protein
VKADWPPPLQDLAEEVEAACRDAFDAAKVTSIEAAPAGHSGFTYFLHLDRRPGAAVVRVPPPGARPVGPADVVRQGRIMAALFTAGLPAPEVMAVREAGATRSGRPFVLMRMVEGENVEVAVRSALPAVLVGAAVRVLADLRRLPMGATGIGDEQVQPPVRQVDRWEPLMSRGPPELVVRGPELATRLRRLEPNIGEATLTHGDFTLGNLLFSKGEVAAVLDWEIAELGPPEVDLACLCVTALRRRLPGLNRGGEAMVSAEEVLALAGGYRAMEWFIAAGCFKYAAILAYNLDLHLRGRRVDPVYEGLRETIPGLIEAGLEALA